MEHNDLNNDYPDASDNSTFSSEDSFTKNEDKNLDSFQKKDSGTYKQPDIFVNVNLPKEDNTEAIKANKISIIGIIINLALFTITLFALYQTKKSVDISANALQDSRQKDSISFIRERGNDSTNRRKDSIYNARDSIKYNLAKSQFDNSRIKDSISSELSQKSLEQQINYMKEMKKEFDAENTPYLQFENLRIIYYDSAKRIIVLPQINNLGKAPTKVLSHNVYFGFSRLPNQTLETFKSQINFKQSVAPIEKYFIKENPQDYALEPLIPFSTDLYNSLKRGELLVYVYGKVFYVNIVSGKERVYEFFFEIHPKTATQAEYYYVIYNENYALSPDQ